MTDLIPAGNIIRKIFIIRDFGGMMDRDQAEIYGVKKAKIKGAALNENQAYIHITLAAFRSGHFLNFSRWYPSASAPYILWVSGRERNRAILSPRPLAITKTLHKNSQAPVPRRSWKYIQA
jgi:Leu/Phe-tRNA-protein transferase